MTELPKNLTTKATKKGFDDSVLNKPRPKATSYDLTELNFNLPTPQRDGFVRQWILAKFVPMYEKKNWDFVYDENGVEMKQVLNSKFVDEPEFGFYMETPIHWYQDRKQEEDMARKEMLEAINNNQHAGANAGLKTTRSIKNNLK